MIGDGNKKEYTGMGKLFTLYSCEQTNNNYVK